MSKTSPTNDVVRAPHVWVFTTYFAEGFPYTIVRMISSVFFRDMKVSLEAIGLTSLYGLPWVLKFLWGPQIDQYGTKRIWMLWMQTLLVLTVLFISLLAGFPQGVRAVAVLLFVGACIAATNDMAIDGYYMEALDEKGQAKFVGYRVMAYRISMMTGTGVIVTIGTLTSWQIGYLSAGVLLLLLLLYHLFFLPRAETYGAPMKELFRAIRSGKLALVCLTVLILIVGWQWLSGAVWWRGLPRHVPFLNRVGFAGWAGMALLLALLLLALFKERMKKWMFRDPEAFYTRAFMAYMDRPRIGLALAFIVLMRTGESMLTAMVSPFMVDLGIKVHYGWISGGVGLPFSILGAMLGGWLISRYSLRKMIWPFLLAQNLTNVVYMLLALMLGPYLTINAGADAPTPIGSLNLALVASVHAFDQLAGGLGTAVLVTFLMRSCLPEFKAAHFAVGTGLMNISGVLSGVLSGFLAGWLGYGYFFGISFLASLPGMALIPWIPFVKSKEK